MSSSIIPISKPSTVCNGLEVSCEGWLWSPDPAVPSIGKRPAVEWNVHSYLETRKSDYENRKHTVMSSL